MDNYLNDSGEIDFDKLLPDERETYLKALDNVANSQITLETWKKYISHLREAVETALVDEPEYIHSEILPFLKRKNPRVEQLKARLKNYLIFERFFSTSDTAKATLDMYKKRLLK